MEYERLTIASDFIFGKIMQNERLALQLIQRIFPEMDIDRVEVITTQKDIKNSYGAHGIRLDVYVKADGRAFTIEMQVVDTKEIPLRMRYYQSTTDGDLLNKGVPYSELMESYIVFICPFNPFPNAKVNHRFRSFRNYCDQDKELALDDKAVKVVLNAAGTDDKDTPADLGGFLDYVIGKKDENDPFVMELDEAVHMARKNEEWRREYMTLVQRDLENRKNTAELMLYLARSGRMEDMVKAANDTAYLNHLLSEYKNKT